MHMLIGLRGTPDPSKILDHDKVEVIGCRATSVLPGTDQRPVECHTEGQHCINDAASWRGVSSWLDQHVSFWSVFVMVHQADSSFRF